MKRLTLEEIEAEDAQTLLGLAVNTSAALLEVVCELMMKGVGDPSSMALDTDTIRGLHELAIEQGRNLRARFDDMVEARDASTEPDQDNERQCQMTAAADQQRAVIPQGWREVASIDFAGLDRDCEERIIYKTPGGKLKASKSCENDPVVIEDVTRKQVVRWILECVIPEEFEPDFSLVIALQTTGEGNPKASTAPTAGVGPGDVSPR